MNVQFRNRGIVITTDLESAIGSIIFQFRNVLLDITILQPLNVWTVSREHTAM